MDRSRRQRVLDAIELRSPDQLPKDLGGMNSTGVSCFAYPKLVEALGLEPRRPRIHDTGQMLALPDIDVLDALDCDVAHVGGASYTNAFDEPEKWKEYDFGGRLDALVMNPENYEVQTDGTVIQRRGNSISRMPTRAHVFDSEHAGQVLDLAGDLNFPDLNAVEKRLQEQLNDTGNMDILADYCRRARNATDRAIMFSGISAGLGFYGGIPNWSMICMTDPGLVHEYHDLVTRYAADYIKLVVPKIADSVDILMLCADDQGLQTGPILPPAVFEELFVGYYKRVNDAVHKAAPKMKTFLHSCGAIYDLLDVIIDSGFDSLNPVQWSAGTQTYTQWKDKARGRICLWGGGVNTQSTLPLGTVDDVRNEVREVTEYLSRDSGFVFCAIHNILAEIEAEKIVTMYATAGAV